jgi:hypothetical protein
MQGPALNKGKTQSIFCYVRMYVHSTCTQTHIMAAVKSCRRLLHHILQSASLL